MLTVVVIVMCVCTYVCVCCAHVIQCVVSYPYSILYVCMHMCRYVSISMWTHACLYICVMYICLVCVTV